MPSNVFKNTLIKALGNKYKGRLTEQEALILQEAEGKKMSLEAVYRARAEEGFSQTDINNFFEAAEERVEDILNLMANEDVEELVGQQWFRENKKSKTKVAGVGLLRDKKGRFISPLNLERLINLSLYRHAIANMGVNGQLMNRTGRLANSGTVTEIRITPSTRNVSFFYTYMLYPYQVFENPAYPQLNPAGLRSPKQLFKDAINDALNELLSPSSLSTITKRLIFRGDRS